MPIQFKTRYEDPHHKIVGLWYLDDLTGVSIEDLLFAFGNPDPDDRSEIFPIGWTIYLESGEVFRVDTTDTQTPLDKITRWHVRASEGTETIYVIWHLLGEPKLPRTTVFKKIPGYTPPEMRKVIP